MCHSSFRSAYTFTAHRADDWKVVVGAHKFMPQGAPAHIVALYDSRMHRKLWEIQMPEQVSTIGLEHHNQLVVASRGAVVRPE